MIRFSALLNTAPNAIRLTPDERGDATLTYQIRSGNPEVDAMASQFSWEWCSCTSGMRPAVRSGCCTLG